jgi:hypothetical protein
MMLVVTDYIGAAPYRKIDCEIIVPISLRAVSRPNAVDIVRRLAAVCRLYG